MIKQLLFLFKLLLLMPLWSYPMWLADKYGYQWEILYVPVIIITAFLVWLVVDGYLVISRNFKRKRDHYYD